MFGQPDPYKLTRSTFLLAKKVSLVGDYLFQSSHTSWLHVTTLPLLLLPLLLPLFWLLLPMLSNVFMARLSLLVLVVVEAPLFVFGTPDTPLLPVTLLAEKEMKKCIGLLFCDAVI